VKRTGSGRSSFPKDKKSPDLELQLEWNFTLEMREAADKINGVPTILSKALVSEGASEEDGVSWKKGAPRKGIEGDAQTEDVRDKEFSGFGAYLNSLPKYPLLDEDEEITLSAIAQKGGPEADAAKEVMILSNLRLVISMARRYAHCGCPLEDLVSEGSIGLGIAVDKFNPSHGARFATYATWWIRQQLRKATNDYCRTIRIPIYQQKTLREIGRVVDRIKTSSGYDPSDDEVAAELEISPKVVQNLRSATVPLVSLQNQVGPQEESRTYEEILCDQTGSGETPLELLSKKTAADSIIELIRKRLNAKEREVIMLRFGLGGAEEDSTKSRTLEEVGRVMNLTRERIRQIQEGALKKLKRSLQAEASSLPTLLTIGA
jgi:RNA polymerase sigma factor (sigma-70 family)